MSIVYEPAECDCRQPWCDNLHSPGWWVRGVSFETEAEAEKYLAKLGQQLAAGTHYLDANGAVQPKPSR